MRTMGTVDLIQQGLGPIQRSSELRILFKIMICNLQIFVNLAASHIARNYKREKANNVLSSLPCLAKLPLKSSKFHHLQSPLGYFY